MERRIMLALLSVLLLVACTQSPAASSAQDEAVPVFAFSEAVVGPNRLAIGLIRNGSPVNDPAAVVKLKIFDLRTNNPTPLQESQATYYGQGLPAGIWVAYADFAEAGNVGIEIQATMPGQTTPTVRRYNLEVKAVSDAPRVGEPAVITRTLTVADVPNLNQLTSGADPDQALYQISFDQALTQGKPIALLFATPNFCRTATCGPSVTVLSQLQQKYGDRMIFIHSEVYRYPFGDSARLQAESIAKAQQEGRNPTAEELSAGLSDAMVAWDLPSEPWLFLIDAKGIIAARYEGGITSEELTPAIEQLLAGQPITG
jgi:hypothetical protein